MSPPTTPLLYRVRHVEEAPAPEAPWAITVQSGANDPAPRVLAYARAEHIAQRICLALRQSDRIAREDNATTATAYSGEATDARITTDDA
jgi:hypothetical protein